MANRGCLRFRTPCPGVRLLDGMHRRLVNRLERWRLVNGLERRRLACEWKNPSPIRRSKRQARVVASRRSAGGTPAFQSIGKRSAAECPGLDKN